MYQISHKRVRVLQKKIRSGSLITDLRGKHENRPKKIKSDIFDLAAEHLKTFPSRKSHYAREKSDRRFFENPCLNVTMLFTYFKEYYKKQTSKTLNISYTSYYHFFKSYKYSFSLPKTDVCDYCTECKIKLKQYSDDQCKAMYELHVKDFHDYQKLKQKYISFCNQENKRKLIVEFDYAQNLPLPKLNVISQFYKRVLWQYIFNVHYHNDNTSTFYYFLENESKKDSNTVCSFVYHFLSKCLAKEENFTEIILFSDGCGGQNKNSVVTSFCVWLSAILDIKIVHVFPVRGHSFNQCNRNFAKYSKILKKKSTVESVQEYLHVL
ncbi:hypothetical protein ALC62_15384 [Cyphomyrmex costatus]|uniref:DUF7869 domain-containing protein n=1 Tax=Cyphomyrmex costatus TaxID=456900 RepID=A0A151I760_9HYME|nr:hypothetical protein ALC62_15384 [Cyphomyrmex costatus]